MAHGVMFSVLVSCSPRCMLQGLMRSASHASAAQGKGMQIAIEHAHGLLGCQPVRHVAIAPLKPESVNIASLRLSMASQRETGEWWHGAKAGGLSPWQQALALGMREASKELHGQPKLGWIAQRVKKADGSSPSASAVCQFFKRVDSDPDWFPGKISETKRGRKPVLTPSKRRRLASSAMAMKARGDEPSVEEVIQRCPTSSLNPKTNKPFSKKWIQQKVFLEDCYDFDPDRPWRFQAVLQKRFIPTDIRQQRLEMAKLLLKKKTKPAWWFNNIVWMDPCASILPGSRQQYDKMRQALKGKKRYVSDDAKLYSRNLTEPSTVLKQNSWGSRKVNWLMVLAKGVLHVEVLPEDWKLDGEGMAEAASRLPKALRQMLGKEARLPRTLFTDRGTGMYSPGGSVVREYEDAVEKAGIRLYWGPSAKQQAPDLGDVLLHETAVSWFRAKMRVAKPDGLPWEETQDQWAARARKVVRDINNSFDVHGLCLEFPSRLQSLVGSDGDRLRK